MIVGLLDSGEDVVNVMPKLLDPWKKPLMLLL